MGKNTPFDRIELYGCFFAPYSAFAWTSAWTSVRSMPLTYASDCKSASTSARSALRPAGVKTAVHQSSSVIEIVAEGNTWNPEWIGFVESAFALRRKTLVNSLSSGGKYSKESILAALKALDIKETVRSEELQPADLVKMYEILHEGKDEN